MVWWKSITVLHAPFVTPRWAVKHPLETKGADASIRIRKNWISPSWKEGVGENIPLLTSFIGARLNLAKSKDSIGTI